MKLKEIYNHRVAIASYLSLIAFKACLTKSISA